MAGEDEGRSRYSRFVSERQEYQDRRVGLPRQRSEMVGASQADRRSDRSWSQVSQLSVRRGAERDRRDCRRDYPVSPRRVRSGGFGERDLGGMTGGVAMSGEIVRTGGTSGTLNQGEAMDEDLTHIVLQ